MATPRRAPDACSLLDADHRNVKKLFKEYEALTESKARSAPQKKRELADRICRELTVHTQIEDEIFYPALRGASKAAASMLDEAEVEHASAKDLIAQIEQGDESDPKFDARVTVLGEYVDHHVREERNEIFPKARASKLDLVAMRDQLAARKEELMAQQQEDVAALA